MARPAGRGGPVRTEWRGSATAASRAAPCRLARVPARAARARWTTGTPGAPPAMEAGRARGSGGAGGAPEIEGAAHHAQEHAAEHQDRAEPYAIDQRLRAHLDGQHGALLLPHVAPRHREPDP